MSDAPISVALVGYGYFAQFHLEAWCRLERFAKPVAIVEQNAGRREQAVAHAQDFGFIVKPFEDLSSLFSHYGGNQLGLLDFATPPKTHAALIREALGKTGVIVCQKPFCLDLNEATRITAEAEAAKCALFVHENFRFQPWHTEIKKLIQSGALGEIVQAEFRFRPGDGGGEQAYLERQPYFRDMPQFLIRETGVHYIDLFRFLFGEPISLSADLYRSNPLIAGEDSGTFCFVHGNGARIRFDGNRTLDHAAANRRLTMGEFLVEGNKASLTLNGDGRIHLRNAGQNTWLEHFYEFRDHGFGGDCVFLFQQALLRALNNGEIPSNSARDYLRNLELQALIYGSSHNGRTVRLGASQ